MKKVATYDNLFEANIAKGLLDSNNIHSEIISKNDSSFIALNTTPIELMVLEKDYSLAKSLLNATSKEL